jgi:integrase
MSSLDKRGKNSYRLRWLENGERKQETFNANTFEEAKLRKRQKDDELFRMKNSQFRINDLWELYKRARPRRNNVPHEEAYIKRFNEFFKNCFLYEITKSSLNNYKNWLLKQRSKNYKSKKVYLSNTYVSNCLKNIQSVWNYGIDEGILDQENNIFHKFNLPKKSEREYVLSVNEFNHLYETTQKDNPLYAEFMKLLIQTGWRRGELSKLKWEDIHDKHIILRKTKSEGKDQIYPAFTFIKQTLQDIYNLQKNHCEYVWADKNGKQLSKETISRMCSRYMKKAGFPEGVTHTLRHSFATNSQANGLTMYEAKILLRQSSIGMTERYSHLVPNQIDENKVDFLKPKESIIMIDGEKRRLDPKTNILEKI